MKRIVVSFCVSITAFVANFTCFALTDDTGGMSGEEMAVIDAINELRAQRGLSCLQPADHMLSGARQSANAQAHRRQCGHFVGLQGASGEICAQTSGGARHAAKMWLNSPDHRRIMLSTSAACISVGVVNGYYAARVGRGHSAKRANFQAATQDGIRILTLIFSK